MNEVSSQQLQASPPIDVTSVCCVLRPLFDLGDFRDLNGPAGWRLAELIYPRNASDLTVAQLLSLLRRISDEMEAQA
ncbi:hypothetical protein [Pseudoxanthomonas winnipegensis]|uniref:hypothetical protein n=1 Tax=Pseudoxanthomonas winnipegensis TaxID=2480810 RepID=UPI00102DA3FB|nr:hypothetical protein [Pseudoxanthomonas winnipegensis]RZZ82376.1 hypothetical protein EA662_16755 [Pseudoxanthomonas winnipegensis]TAA41448.1 hypothetical protein EAT51_10360 [Pseudoxanthomonas winnipegensis]TBV69476.1 hypothetical protein EYC46_19170 [Pseudoxanthomonas winnipegensis]